jgi:hypothetical protein
MASKACTGTEKQSAGGAARADSLSAAERRAISTKGGKARAAKLTPDARKKLAQKAAAARWAKTA